VKARYILIVGAITLLLFVAASLLFAIVNTRQALSHLQDFEFHSANLAAKRAEVVVQPLATLTLHKSSLMNGWESSLQSITVINSLAETAQKYLPAALQASPESKQLAILLHQDVVELVSELSTAAKTVESHGWLKKLVINQLSPNLQQLIKDPEVLQKTLADAQFLTQKILTGQHRYVIVLQNSEELRATGGFMGSYAVLELSDGQVMTFKVQDIYEPDGQFSGLVEAPPGLKEYLSGGKGMRLPDSNWHPDFPSAAQEILQFFALGKQSGNDGLVAINLQVIEQILEVIGPVQLPENKQFVNAQNLSSIARSDRSTFFPGSQQKKNFLQSLLNQLEIVASNLPIEKQQQIVRVLARQFTAKNIQVFSHDLQIQQVLHQYHFDGQITAEDAQAYFFLVESNVGINKANKDIQRQVQIEVEEYRTRITITFMNHSDSLAYINYQRLITLPDTKVHQLVVAGTLQTQWDEQILNTADGRAFNQLGFLVISPPLEQTTVVMEVSHPSRPDSSLKVQRQAGLPSTPYTIKHQGKTTTFLLEEDHLIE